MLSWQLLQDSRYRTYWISLFASQLGTWMQSAAQGWLVIELTGSAERLGLVVALQFLPSLLFSLFAGVISDRYPRRNLLIFTQGSMAVLALAMTLLLLADWVRYEHVLLFAFLYGTANALDMPVRQAFTVELAGRDRYPGAISLNAFSFNLSRLLGPAISGLLIAAVGMSWSYFLNALSFLPLLWMLFYLPAERVQPRPSVGILEELSQGVRYVWGHPLMRQVILLLGATSMFGLNFQTLVPAYARLELGLDAQGYGFLISAVGVGSMLAALVQALAAKARPLRSMMGSALLGLGLMVLILPLSPTWVAFWLGVAGFGGITAMVNANTTVQTLAPDAIRGRVMAFYSMVMLGAGPPGAYLCGWLAHHLGGQGAAFVLGLLTVLAVGLLARFAWPRTLEREASLG